MAKASANAISVWPGRLALLLALMTFPLIWIGGLVTTTKSGMAVPDWPSTYEHNMFTYPLERWLGNNFSLFIEHFHRLWASSVGFVAILLLVSTFFKGVPGWAKQLSLLGLGLVISQGALGGVRVLLDQRMIAMVHGCLGPFYFAYVCGLAYLFRPACLNASVTGESKLPSLPPKWLAGALLLLAGPYLQLCIGAFLRHVPLTVSPDVFGLVILMHITLAFALTVQSFVFFSSMWGKSFALPRWKSGLVVSLMLLQVVAGGATYALKYGFPAWLDSIPWIARFVVEERSTLQSSIVTFHVANGSLIVGLGAIIAVQIWRMRAGYACAIAASTLSLGGAA